MERATRHADRPHASAPITAPRALRSAVVRAVGRLIGGSGSRGAFVRRPEIGPHVRRRVL
jgi:hypothetical protein